MGWIGMQVPAVSKCALATEGCAPAAPCLLTFCCNYFTTTPRDDPAADENLGEDAARTSRPAGHLLADRQDRVPFSGCARTPHLDRRIARLLAESTGAGRPCRPSGNGVMRSESRDLRGEAVRRGPHDHLNDAAGTHHAEGTGRSQCLLINLRLIGDLDAQTRDTRLEISDVLLAAETGDDV